MPGSCDGFSDRFEFRIEVDESKLPPPYVRDHDDAKVQFACRFHCQGTQYWDNNQSRNYVFQNVPISGSNGGTNSTSTSAVTRIPALSSRYSSFDDYDYNASSSGSNLSGSLPPPPPVPQVQAPPRVHTAPPPPLPPKITNHHQNNNDYYGGLGGGVPATSTATSAKGVAPTSSVVVKKPDPIVLDFTSSSNGKALMPDLSSSSSSSGTATSPVVSTTYGGGGGSHLSGTLYSPSLSSSVSFYEHAYGCYNQYGSACFY